MDMVEAKCPNCGAKIKVDKGKDSGICEYCGSAFVTEKAINNFGTYIEKQEINNSIFGKKAKAPDNEWTYKILKEKNEAEKRKMIDSYIGFGFVFLIIIFMFAMIFIGSALGIYFFHFL